MTVEVLLGINSCPWRAISVFQQVRDFFEAQEKVDLVWCPKDNNESAYETVNWIESIIKCANKFLSNVPPTEKACILHDSFATLDN